MKNHLAREEMPRAGSISAAYLYERHSLGSSSKALVSRCRTWQALTVLSGSQMLQLGWQRGKNSRPYSVNDRIGTGVFLF